MPNYDPMSTRHEERREYRIRQLERENTELREENEDLKQIINRYRAGIIELVEAFRALGRPGVVLVGRRR